MRAETEAMSLTRRRRWVVRSVVTVALLALLFVTRRTQVLLIANDSPTLELSATVALGDEVRELGAVPPGAVGYGIHPTPVEEQLHCHPVLGPWGSAFPTPRFDPSCRGSDAPTAGLPGRRERWRRLRPMWIARPALPFLTRNATSANLAPFPGGEGPPGQPLSEVLRHG